MYYFCCLGFLIADVSQLGYSVSCDICDTYGVLGFTIEVVSSSHSLSAVRSAIAQFAEVTFPTILRGQTTEQYASHIDAVLTSLKTPSLSLNESTRLNWSEITDRRYWFSSRRDRIGILLSISHAEVFEFYSKFMLGEPKETSHRSLLVIESQRHDTVGLKIA